jgi:hypothetical protein
LKVAKVRSAPVRRAQGAAVRRARGSRVFDGSWESGGINRHGGGDGRAWRRRLATHGRPESCVDDPQGRGEGPELLVDRQGLAQRCSALFGSAVLQVAATDAFLGACFLKR